MMDSFCLNIVRLIFLIQGLIWGEMAKHVSDPDVADMLETRSMTGWMIWGQPDILPVEKLENLKWMVKGFIMGALGSLFYKVWSGLIGG
jgi:hypothetical protein